ncbi:MAG: ATP-binding cassette domain-containing protein, partial [Ruminococcus sp.]|nr:ATP-binding cassette domain-containing protein [Ruminococcus sp.]
MLHKIILKNFDLIIKPGEIHVLMGQNGAGKSTVCRSIL